MSNTLIQEVLTLVLLAATGPENYFATMTTVLFKYYDSLVDTLNNMNSLKLKSFPGNNISDNCALILLDSE